VVEGGGCYAKLSVCLPDNDVTTRSDATAIPSRNVTEHMRTGQLLTCRLDVRRPENKDHSQQPAVCTNQVVPSRQFNEVSKYLKLHERYCSPEAQHYEHSPRAKQGVTRRVASRAQV
jgi:hypothetical protein